MQPNIEHKFWKKSQQHKIKILDNEDTFVLGFIVETYCEEIDLHSTFQYYIDKYSDAIINNRQLLEPISWTITIRVYDCRTVICLETFAQFIYHRDLSKFIKMVGCNYTYHTTYKDEDGLLVHQYKFYIEGPMDFNRFQSTNIDITGGEKE